jgi:hypothetical protein
MNHGFRLEVYAWEFRTRLRREAMEKLWRDPKYQLMRQAQLDQGKVMGQIFLGVAVLVGISYIFFP